MAFRDGVAMGRLKPKGKVGGRNTGTRLRFWPDPEFFDSPGFWVFQSQTSSAGKSGAVPRAADRSQG
ncbi:MAG: hypothetical protein CM1200mP20_17050 [Pseudomonadota bacterium]|nr:MAG: hypothetical protein CM1200mP20_17050 [Pseudomonadota bacterium]